MALKPCPRTAILVQESVEARLNSSGLTEEEKEQLQEFYTDLDHYLVGYAL